MANTWSTYTARFLTNWTICPRCGVALGGRTVCPRCRADLTTTIAHRVQEASSRAAEAITTRQELIDTLTTASATVEPTAPTATVEPGGSEVRTPAPVLTVLPVEPPESTAAPTRAAAAPLQSSGSQVSVQSVLAVAGAALFAVAAIVFTFLNPDLTNFGTRTAIVGGITVLFLGGAWLLARAKLQFSAEAIGALGMVFVVLDVWAFSTIAWPGVSGWLFGGVGTLAASAAMITLASLARIRSWFWVAVAGATIAPAFFGYAAGGGWNATLGHLGVVVFAVVAHDLIRRMEPRFRQPLVADHSTATTIQLVGSIVVLAQLVVSPGVAESAAVIAVLAAAAAVSTRNQLAAFWSTVAGGLLVVAVGILPLEFELADFGWHIATVPLAAAIALAALAGIARLDLRRPGTTIHRRALLRGGWTVTLFAALPAAYIGAIQCFSALTPEISATEGGQAILGLSGTVAGTFALSFVLRAIAARTEDPRDATLARNTGVTALWMALATALAVITWPALTDIGRVGAGLVLALALALLATRSQTVRELPAAFRLPVVAGAHLTLITAAAVAWTTPTLGVVGGAAAVLVTIGVAQTVPALYRPAHAAIGFAFALVLVANALLLANLETITVLCLTTTVASLFALTVTLVRRLSAGFWYAILAVTLVPFLLGVVSVLFVRSGWTALSTGVTFALAVTLLVTRRPGLSRYLRTFAAALLVPALAVVVICLGAQFILVSASPITLPIIALLVACVLPSTNLMGTFLLRHGLPTADVRDATLWIEVSALITGALAVVLALVRAAAGLNTSFLVLLIIGLGAAVAALTTKRRYAWVVAGASWTGALWCIWALAGITVIEPYLLPPALAAAIVGAISVGRRLPGVGLYSIGLACAVVPSLVTLAIVGGSDGAPWRTAGLLAGAVVLGTLGAIPASRSKRRFIRRLGMLRTPTLLIAILTASAGTVAAVRLGLSLDAAPSSPVILPALALSAASAVLAAAAGRFLRAANRTTRLPVLRRLRDSRWIHAPAALYLAVGPITAIRSDWVAIWTLWALTVFFLALMITSAVFAGSRRVLLPPVWFLFVLAWCSAVAGWSERELRVEAFSLLLGFGLLVAGTVATRTETNLAGRSLNSWPAGYSGSWRLLAPGIIVVLLPSVLATGTDPQTLRAILVIGLALIAILIGSLRKLAAPFILGIIVLPLENITVFAVQVGQSIGAAPWWITLATAGAVLLVVSVTYERRDAGNRGVAARLRDLR